MNRFKIIYPWTFLFSIALFIAGQLLFVPAFKLLEPKVDSILFQITENKAAIKTSLLFSLLLALIPLFIVFTWRLAPVVSSNKKIASAILILLFVLTGIFIRRQMVMIYFTTIVRPALLTHGKTSVLYPIDPVNFVYYMFGGLITGSILSFIAFKQKNKYKR